MEKPDWLTKHEKDDNRQFGEQRQSMARVEQILKDQNISLEHIMETLKPFEDAATFKRVGVVVLVTTTKVIGAILAIAAFLKLVYTLIPHK